MSRFLTQLAMKRGPKKDWILTEPLFYESSLAKRTIMVPTGFESDLDSVPRWPVIFWLFKGVADEAAVVHDWLYCTGEVPREMADAIFREAMDVLAVPGWRKWPIWAAVRAGGESHWNGAKAVEPPAAKDDTYFG